MSESLVVLLIVVGLLVLWLAISVALPAAVAVSRGRSGWAWGAAGLLFGPLLIPVLYVLPSQSGRPAPASA
jgi:ABC-type spermidine/putrescine transport system permease subunit II